MNTTDLLLEVERLRQEAEKDAALLGAIKHICSADSYGEGVSRELRELRARIDARVIRLLEINAMLDGGSAAQA